MAMGKDARPQTPAKLITRGSPNNCDDIKQSYIDANKITKPTPVIRKSRNISIYNQLESPLSPNKADADVLSANEGEEDVEATINQLLILIENNQSIEINLLKETLKKCLFSINHYKLQNQILRFNSTENMKRSEIENELMKKQIDQLVLKSPFVPSKERMYKRINDNVSYYSGEEEEEEENTLRSSKSKKRLSKKDNKLKTNMRLVEKQNPNQKETGFNDHIKVFHLEKAEGCW